MHSQNTLSSVQAETIQEKQKNLEGQHEELIKGKPQKMGTVQTFFTLLKGFMGTGLLFLPNGYSNSGWMFGTGAIIMSMLVTMVCGILLIQVSSKYKGTFSELGFLAMGTLGRYICDLVLALSQAGFVTVHIVFISQNLNSIFEYHWGFTINIWIMGLIFFVIYTPLCWVRKIQTLGKYHILGDLTVLLAAGMLVAEAVLFYVHRGSFADDIESYNSDKYLVFLGTAIFIFEGVGVVIPVRDACRDKEHFPAIFMAMMLVLTCILIFFGFFNYAVYGDELLSNAPMVTKILRKGDVVVEIVMVLFIINLIFSYPLVIYPSNVVIESYSIDKMTPSISRTWLRNLSRALVVFITFFIGIYFEDSLDRLLSVVGSLTCTPVAFIMPAVLHLNLVAKTRLAKTIDYSIICLGIALLVGITSHTILNWE
ncbi:unnamed protein product [Moneuplotes crassus]|uniref:Amino acid transporter transmembrane domain-containing protein n=1 Tax=Euplotes crassus TaxID=5936 RepID=A0AAD1UBR6_EUPCR|nr:unnamed protein product [Moneuplotes crassus]